MVKKILLIALLQFCQAAIADELKGKVINVTDGDTVRILDDAKVQYKVRLEGIDAPEKKQAFGNKSKETLTTKIAGKSVIVQWKHKDRYGRIIGIVLLDQKNINLEMVQEGMAWHYKHFSKSKELESA